MVPRHLPKKPSDISQNQMLAGQALMSVARGASAQARRRWTIRGGDRDHKQVKVRLGRSVDGSLLLLLKDLPKTLLRGSDFDSFGTMGKMEKRESSGRDARPNRHYCECAQSGCASAKNLSNASNGRGIDPDGRGVPSPFTEIGI